jgi:hypothetical protein
MKDIKGFEGLYAITEDGRVWSYPRKENNKRRIFYLHGRFRKPQVNTAGYFHVALIKNGRTKVALLHRLIAAAFIPNPKRLREVNHKNGKKRDNRIQNLEWCNHRQNCRHASEAGLMPRGTQNSKAKLTDANVIEIRFLFSQGNTNCTHLGQKFGVTASAVRRLVRRVTWKHILNSKV